MPRVVRRIAPSSCHLGRLQHLPSGGRGALPHAICNGAAPRTRKCVSLAQSRRSSIVERIALPIPQPVYAHAQSRRLCQALPIRRIELLVADPIRRHRHERLSAALSELNSIALNPEFCFQFDQPTQVGASTLWIAYEGCNTGLATGRVLVRCVHYILASARSNRHQTMGGQDGPGADAAPQNWRRRPSDSWTAAIEPTRLMPCDTKGNGEPICRPRQ